MKKFKTSLSVGFGSTGLLGCSCGHLGTDLVSVGWVCGNLGSKLGFIIIKFPFTSTAHLL